MPRAIPLCLAPFLLVLTTCSEIPGPSTGTPTRLVLHPQFNGTAAQSAPINRIVITAREATRNQLIGSIDQLVDATASSWQLTLDVELTGISTRDVVLAMELMHSDATSQTVEWSGITVVAVTPGKDSQVANVPLYAGPLAPVATIAVSPTQASLAVGGTLILGAVVRDAQNNALSRTITWSSSDTTKAVVSSSGVVNGRAAGTATISARVEGKQATSAVTVYVPVATSIEKRTGDAQTGNAGSQLALPLEVQTLDQNRQGIGGQGVQWVVTSGGGSITPTTTTTNATGNMQARFTLGPNAGTQTVEARAAGLTGSPIVFTATAIAAVQVNSITLNPTSRTLVSGDTATFVATARDASNAVLTNVVFTWTSSDTTVARVSASGRVTASGAGSATITAAAGGKSGTATVTVTAAGARILFNYGGDGQAQVAGARLREAITVRVADFAGNPASGVDVTFTVIDGGGTLNVIQPRTDQNGFASAEWTLGSAPGLQHVQASAAGLANSPVQFEATATTAQGIKRTWVGGSSRGAVNWRVAQNWSPVGVPGDPDSVVIPATANQPRADGYVYTGTLIVQSGATANTSGYTIYVTGNLDVAGAVIGNGSLTMTGANKTVRGAIEDIRIDGTVTAIGAVTTTRRLYIGEGGNLSINGQTVTVGGDFAAAGGTITMNSSQDLLEVRGSATFANNDQRNKLNGGIIRVAGNFETGCYNSTEFVSTNTLLIMAGNGTVQQRIQMCSSATGSRFKDLTIAAGARVITGSNPVVVERGLNVVGILSVEATGVVDVMGPAGSLVVNMGGTLNNAGLVKANLPITNAGTVIGNAVVQR